MSNWSEKCIELRRDVTLRKEEHPDYGDSILKCHLEAQCSFTRERAEECPGWAPGERKKCHHTSNGFCYNDDMFQILVERAADYDRRKESRYRVDRLLPDGTIQVNVEVCGFNTETKQGASAMIKELKRHHPKDKFRLVGITFGEWE